MIKLSRREDYAVILVNELAKEYKKRLIPLSEIAGEYSISLLFLRKKNFIITTNEFISAGIA